jgi:hypothetical protein
MLALIIATLSCERQPLLRFSTVIVLEMLLEAPKSGVATVR